MKKVLKNSIGGKCDSHASVNTLEQENKQKIKEIRGEISLRTQLIGKMLKKKSYTSTLIDVVFTTKPKSFLQSGTYEPHVSDHQLIYTIMKAHEPKPAVTHRTIRDFRSFDDNAYIKDLEAEYHFTLLTYSTT